MQLRERRKNSSVYISVKQVGKSCTMIITDLLIRNNYLIVRDRGVS